MISKPEYSIVIPCYNSDKSLIEIADRINDIFSNKLKESYEIILVDDGSKNPNTWETLKKLTEKFPNNIKSIKLTRNFGQHYALYCGYAKSSGNYILTMDDDLEHNPDDMLKLIEHKSHDYVVAKFINKSHSSFVKTCSYIKSWFDFLLIGTNTNIKLSVLSLVKRNILDEALKINISDPYIPAIILEITNDIIPVEVTHGVRKFGKTNNSLKKKFILFYNLLFNNSSLPLKIVGRLGLLMSLISFIYAIFALYQKIANDTGISGWTSIIVINTTIGGLILFSIGIIGEYLLRIIRVAEKRSPYAIKEEIGFNSKK